MTHPMAEPWIDWRDIATEPRGIELLLYWSEEHGPWVGNHPEGCYRGKWEQSTSRFDGGKPLLTGSGAITPDPTKWARIPLPDPQ